MSIFLTVTFYGKNKLLYTTNTTDDKRIKVVDVIVTTLGPFCRFEKLSPYAVLLTHVDPIFGSKFHNEPVDTTFALVKFSEVPSFNISMAIHERLEAEIWEQIENEVTDLYGGSGVQVMPNFDFEPKHSGDVVGIKRYVNLPDEGRDPEKLIHLKHKILLKTMKAFQKKKFTLESSINVFGPSSPNFLLFGYNSRPELISQQQIWGMTVSEPFQVALINEPHEASLLVQNETKSWGNAHGFGKDTLSELFSKLALFDYHCIGSADGFYILQKQDNIAYQRDPPIISCSIVSDKKLQFLSSFHAWSELVKFMEKLDACGLRIKVASHSNNIRVFDEGSFSYDSGLAVSKHMDIYLKILIEFDKLGYDLYTAGNLSNKCLSLRPHTWFFIKKPERSVWRASSRSAQRTPRRRESELGQLTVQLPPAHDNISPTESDGLPTYEEVMRQAVQHPSMLQNNHPLG